MSAELRCMVVGPVATNCYLLVNKETRECVVVDPGDCGAEIASNIRKEGLEPKAILLTHGHFDHITGIDGLRKTFPVPLYAGEKEKELLGDVMLNCSASMGSFRAPVTAKPDFFVSEGQVLEIAGFSIKCIETPGHTVGGISYYVESEELLFSGDTLFEGSVGRTDLPTGSMGEIMRSLNDKLMKLPEDTKVFPGHGSATLIGDEKKYNPYCNR